ncbi:MAG: PP2C family serine/threonine-protein phosphatase [Saprospiraceae bacterium]
MNWKAVGAKSIGSSHIYKNKSCDDSISFAIINSLNTDETLVAIISDGAGSAKYGGLAARYTTWYFINRLKSILYNGNEINKNTIYSLLEDIYYSLEAKSNKKSVKLSDFSCTVIGCLLFTDLSILFHIGDGAIVINDGTGAYICNSWPKNGEYVNTTHFLTDDSNLSNLRIAELDYPINEISLFTDGLQSLALNFISKTVHKPFFDSFFPSLRKVTKYADLLILNRKLKEYLSSSIINEKTDDDKTLLLATRIENE